MSSETATTGMASKTNKGKNTTPVISTFKSLFPAGYKVPSLPTDSVTKLKGQENYEEWSAHIGVMIKAIGTHGIVCEGQILDEKADNEKKSLYRVIHSHAKVLIISSVEREIISTIVKLPTCHEIWNYLKAAYYRDTAIDAVGQMKTVFSTVGEKFDIIQPISNFISLFETEWSTLASLTATSTSAFNKKFHSLLTDDEFKINVLLTHLISHILQVVDNITLREYKMFIEVKKKLLSTSLSSSNQESAFYTYKPDGSIIQSSSTSFSSPKSKEKEKKNKLGCT